MGFDVKQALAEIEEQKTSMLESTYGANTANRANPANEPRLAQIARLARKGALGATNQTSSGQEAEKIIVQSMEDGNLRHGAIASSANLGVTVTYQLIERLLSAGRIVQAKDGVLSVVRCTDEP